SFLHTSPPQNRLVKSGGLVVLRVRLHALLQKPKGFSLKRASHPSGASESTGSCAGSVDAKTMRENLSRDRGQYWSWAKSCVWMARALTIESGNWDRTFTRYRYFFLRS